MLYHFSEQSGIARFEPRKIEGMPQPTVWAIDAVRQCNYLLPRDCPRVTYYPGPSTSTEDQNRFLGQSLAVVAIEQAWIERIHKARLYRYRLPTESFQCVDAIAGYYVSERPVTPIEMEQFDDLPRAIALARADLRIFSTLWPLHDEVAASTLAFSMIRMRNASLEYEV